MTLPASDLPVILVTGGTTYDIRHRVKTLQEIDAAAYNAFWEECYSPIARFL